MDTTGTVSLRYQVVYGPTPSRPRRLFGARTTFVVTLPVEGRAASGHRPVRARDDPALSLREQWLLWRSARDPERADPVLLEPHRHSGGDEQREAPLVSPQP